MIKQLLINLVFFIFSVVNVLGQSETVPVQAFNKVIISPHIQVTFREGNQEAVIIEQNKEASEKLNIEVENHTLRIYLDGAKMLTKSVKQQENGSERTVPLYKGVVVSAVVIYKKIQKLSLRGEQTFILESPIQDEKLTLAIYGESQVYINNLILDNLNVTIYGESYLEIKKGSVGRQKVTAYGESKVNALEVISKSTKITAYGDGSFRFNVSDTLKVTSYGEATIVYKGEAVLVKSLVIGEATIERIRE